MSGYHDNNNSSTKRNGKDSTIEPGIHMEYSLEQLKETLRSGVYSLCTAVGMTVVYKLMEEDVTALVGPKGKHSINRIGYRHGIEEASIVLGGQRVTIKRPRVRSKDGKEELPIETYEVAKQDDILFKITLARLLNGLSTRSYNQGQEALPEELKCHGASKSSVSRRFTQAAQGELNRLMSRRFDSLGITALLLDSVEFAGKAVMVAMGIDQNGTKHILGIRLGATENAVVCKDLLADLVERGVDGEEGLLAIIDGAKALHSALKTVYGERVLIQRCQVHKKRNVLDYLSKEQRPLVNRQLNKAWAMHDFGEATQALKGLATQLEMQYPDAAASLREGLEETCTVMRLDISGILQKSLSTTNAIESAFDAVRTRTRNVKRWQNGNMIKCWVAAGLLASEERFSKIKGYKEIQKLRAAIRLLTVDKMKTEVNESKTA